MKTGPKDAEVIWHVFKTAGIWDVDIFSERQAKRIDPTFDPDKGIRRAERARYDFNPIMVDIRPSGQTPETLFYIYTPLGYSISHCHIQPEDLRTWYRALLYVLDWDDKDLEGNDIPQILADIKLAEFALRKL